MGVLLKDRSSSVDLNRPRSVGEILAAAFSLYARFPVLFVGLALVVVAPYELIVLAAAHTSPLGQQSASASTAFILFLLDFALVGPLVSALHVHAVVAIGRGERPGFATVARQGVVVLPVVAAAQIVAGLGIGLGLIAFVIPGLILALRWAVVAQVAAIDRTDWLGALRGSGALSAGNYLHILGLTLTVGIIAFGLTGGGEAIAGSSSHAPQVALGIVVVTLSRSFTALSSAILFFDLVARSAGRTRA